MLKNIQWPENRAYASGTDWEPIQFYLEALNEATVLDLQLGYFSSAAINILSLGFATFISSGGRLRMVINDVLSPGDKEVLTNISEGYIYQVPYDLSDFENLKNALCDYDFHFFQCIGWLIQKKRIDLRIIKPLGKRGTSHYKCGIFSDGQKSVGFSGSCNFTAFGLLENLERIDIFLSWEDHRSEKWVQAQTKEFENIFNGTADYIEYLKVEDIKTAIVNSFGNAELEQLLANEGELLKKKNQAFQGKRTKKIIETSEKRAQEILAAPRFPFAEGPREYQSLAYCNWVANGYTGIFAMATGTGKTITALNCLLLESRKRVDKVYHAIILVPTITLVNQWEAEIKEFNFDEIIKISSKKQWQSTLATVLSRNRRIPTSFILIITYASFIKEKFQRHVKNFPEDMLLVADEAHNIGSPSVLKILSEFSSFKRIALSATPKRKYDIEGSVAMEAFFNDQEPYTYSFSMERAIEEGILCRYFYYPHIVSLTGNELQEYIKITKQLAKFYTSGGFGDSEIAQRLLLKRKRIIHKAENKLVITKDILLKRYQEEGNLKYTFLYVPEGLVTTTNSCNDGISYGQEEEEETKIINIYTRAIAEISPEIMVNQFTSSMKDRDLILDQFKAGKIQVVASMKCLDEGVDIPRAEHAIFCSSTGNPRQFIQRRGRILRRHPDKCIATIHDLVVIPDFSSSTKGSPSYQTEKQLIITELERVMHFASLAINPYYTEGVFQAICDHYELNIYTIQQNLAI